MMTLNGLGVIDAVLAFPCTGIWHADVRVDTPSEITGPVVINVDDGKLFLKGTVSAGGNWQDTGILRVVGGAGGLRRNARPKHYTSTTLRIVLSDLLADAGEALSGKSDGVLSRSIQAWTTAALPIGRLITQLLLSAGPGANWRVLPDGTVWAGNETWPDSGLSDSDFQILSEDPSRAEAEVGLEVPLLMPGTKLGKRKVSYVEHSVGETTRTSVWFATGEANDRLKAALRGAVKSAQAPIDYLANYFAAVVSQSGYRIDVRPKDLRIPSMASVPLFVGVPGWKVEIPPGGRVLIGWSGGDPTQPYAVAFDVSASAAFLGLLAERVTIGPEATAQPTLLAQTYRTAEDVYLAALSTGVAAALSALGLIPAGSAVTTADNAWKAAAATFLSNQVKNS